MPRMSAADAWRRLRMPFVLPDAARDLHVCRWELIDIDCAGCTVCGHVHRCSAGTYSDVETTDDAVVCRVTGVCVNSQRFAEHEFSDNVIVFTSAVNASDCLERRMQLVQAYVHECLVSSHARSIAAYEHGKRVQRHNAHVSKCVRSGCVNLLHLIQIGMPLFLREHFDVARRTQVARECTAHMQCVMCTTQRAFNLVVKDSELRQFVFGMLYLMCRGVHMFGVQILPRVPELAELIPCENNVARFTNFRAKHITETENKFKFVFRHATREHLRRLYTSVQK